MGYGKWSTDLQEFKKKLPLNATASPQPNPVLQPMSREFKKIAENELCSCGVIKRLILPRNSDCHFVQGSKTRLLDNCSKENSCLTGHKHGVKGSCVCYPSCTTPFFEGVEVEVVKDSFLVFSMPPDPLSVTSDPFADSLSGSVLKI